MNSNEGNKIPKKLNFVGKVSKICMGHNTRYIVAYQRRYTNTFPVTSDESITISINNWSEEILPQSGDDIILLGVTKSDRGWRAKRATPFREKEFIVFTAKS